MTSEGMDSTASSIQDQSVKYKKAQTINVSQDLTTTTVAGNLRTISTRLTEGELVIRYTPREAVPPSGQTR